MEALRVIRTHYAVAIGASGSSTSQAIDLTQLAHQGFFSIQVAIAAVGAADPTYKFEYLLSNDGVNFLEPSSASDIATGKTKASGPGSDGKDLFAFGPEPARWMQIKVTETGGASAGTVTVDLFVQ